MDVLNEKIFFGWNDNNDGNQMREIYLENREYNPKTDKYHSKFYYMKEANDSEFIARWGRIGTKGSIKEYKWDEASWEDQLYKKLNKGYVEQTDIPELLKKLHGGVQEKLRILVEHLRNNREHRSKAEAVVAIINRLNVEGKISTEDMLAANEYMKLLNPSINEV